MDRFKRLAIVAREALRALFEEGEKVKEIWNSPWMGIPLWVSAAGCVLYWQYRVPAPGYAIGALAVVAGIMSVREIKIAGKISWVVLLVCLLITEFRAIDKDRADNQSQQKTFFAEQREGFHQIEEQANKDFSVTAKGLEGIIGEDQKHFDKTAKLVDEAINTETGGDSFCYIDFSRPYPFVGTSTPAIASSMIVHKVGKYPVYGVGIRILDHEKANEIALMKQRAGTIHGPQDYIGLGETDYSVGNIGTGNSFPGNYVFVPSNAHDLQILIFSFHAYTITESFSMREVSGKWVKAIRVEVLRGNGPRLRTDEYYKVDEGYPRRADGSYDAAGWPPLAQKDKPPNRLKLP